MEWAWRVRGCREFVDIFILDGVWRLVVGSVWLCWYKWLEKWLWLLLMMMVGWVVFGRELEAESRWKVVATMYSLGHGLYYVPFLLDPMVDLSEDQSTCCESWLLRHFSCGP